MAEPRTLTAAERDGETLSDEPYERRLNEIASITGETCHCRDGHPAVGRSDVLWLISELRALRAALAEARAKIMDHMLAMRDVRDPCPKCGGLGVRTYGNTATWRGGIGGMTMTSDVCDGCWGSGDESRPWPDRRAARAVSGPQTGDSNG